MLPIGPIKYMKRMNISEGKIFTVPIGKGLCCHGLIARTSISGAIMAGYFFYIEIPDFINQRVNNLRIDQAIAAFRFGRLPFDMGRWHLLGCLDGWDRKEWPMPKLHNPFHVNPNFNVSVYNDLDPVEFSHMEFIKDINTNFEDGASGHIYIEERLKDITSSSKL